MCPTLCDPMDCSLHQASPCMGFSRQEYWSGLPSPPPGNLPDPGIKPGSPSLQADALLSEPPGKHWESSKTDSPKFFYLLPVHMLLHFSKTLQSPNAVVPREGSSSVHVLGNDQNEGLKKCIDLFWKSDNPPWSFLDMALLSLPKWHLQAHMVGAPFRTLWVQIQLWFNHLVSLVELPSTQIVRKIAPGWGSTLQAPQEGPSNRAHSTRTTRKAFWNEAVFGYPLPVGSGPQVGSHPGRKVVCVTCPWL